jgi:DNA-binding NarL/FixJ family response regulator
MNRGWAGESRRDTTSRQQRRPVRVIVVARETLIRQALASLLSRVPEFTVIQYTEDVPGIDGLLAEVGEGVLLVDVEDNRPAPDDIVARTLAASPKVAVVVLTPGADAEVAAMWLAAGVKACVPKVSSGIELQNAIRWIAEGAGWISPRLLPRLFSEMRRGAGNTPVDGRLSALTSRELDVLGLLVEGREPKAIARDLGLSIGTVRTHVRHTLSKLDVHSIAAAVSLAHAAGLQPERRRQN